MAEKNVVKAESIGHPKDFEFIDHKAPELDNLSMLGRSQMDSVSLVAIRNIKPPQVDVNDPDQKKLIEKLNQMEVNIWNYSDNKPSFLAKLNKNNPPVQRRAIESAMGSINDEILKANNRRPTTNNSLTGSANFKISQPPAEPADPINSTQKAEGQRKMLHARISIRPKSDDESSDSDTKTFPSIEESSAKSFRSEMKMVIKKTMELVEDMNKSVELVFHAIRATARFLTYPTPSIPSDNYAFGHVKGWIWLIYKGLSNLNTKCEPALLQELLEVARNEMNRLSSQASEFIEAFDGFNKELAFLHENVKKEAKFLKSQNTMWSLRVDGYLKYTEELKLKPELLLNIKEDRPFSSDWVFHPHPSKAELRNNFFHFQWVKTNKSHWENVEFEIRSDYSTRWHPYSSFAPELQMEIVSYLIDHLVAILEEATNFVRINMRLSFDFDEIKCLRFAVAEINSLKKNKRSTEYIGDMTRKLFEDLALLKEISQEFTDQLDNLADTIAPAYESLRKKVNPKLLEPVPPLDRTRTTNRRNAVYCCPCFLKSNKDFLAVYGVPMQAVFLRTPISEDTVERFFPKDCLIPQENQIEMASMSNCINQYGISEGYVPSLFDKDIGREPPSKLPKRLPKLKRKSAANEQGFSLRILIDLSTKAIRTSKDSELDTEIYLQIFEEIRKFLQTFGTLFNFILSELTERIENLENRLYTQLSDYYETLEKMLEHEKSSGLLENDPLICGTRAFRRLHVAFLFFTLFADGLVKLEESEATSYVCKSAYYKSYAKYHSWFVQKSSMFSIYSIPSKIGIYNKVLPKMQVSEIDALFKEFVHRGLDIYEHCEAVFKQKEIKDF